MERMISSFSIPNDLITREQSIYADKRVVYIIIAVSALKTDQM